VKLYHMQKFTVPQSSYPDPYIPALNNLWCHTGSTRPAERGKTAVFTHSKAMLPYSDENTNVGSSDLCIQMKCSDLIYDAAGEDGGGFLAVFVEVERHQRIGPHREVVVHGQNLRSKHFKSLLRVPAVNISAHADKGIYP